jgi:peptidoglycan/LPS O-acetylase OafA/YrhL
MFNVTSTSVGVNMVLFICAIAAMVPLAIIVWALLEAWAARRRARHALDCVQVLEWVRQAAGTHGH